MVLLYILGAIVFINCTYYLYFSKFSFYSRKESVDTPSIPVSVIVCAKNEATNLKKNIPLWLNQNYPLFELVLINDASLDETLEIIEEFAATDKRIKIVDVKNNEAFWGNKKYALTLGIKAARHEHLVFTDADCAPASNNWLSLMASKFSNQKELILGYGAYTRKKGFLNKLIRFETAITAIQYFSFALNGNPYMGVGRNLAYTSNLYFRNNGFMSHIKIMSGDDDLFVNEAATKNNTEICVYPDSFTLSEPKLTYREWFRQKQRHYTTSKFYKPRHKISLGAFYLFNFLFWLVAPLILVTPYWIIGLGIILHRFLFQYLIIGKGIKNLKEKDLIIAIPLYELLLIIIQLSIFISNKGENRIKWK